MHGITLREVEAELPDPHEQIVDVLDQLVWKALIHQFPKEIFDGKTVMGLLRRMSAKCMLMARACT